MVPLNVTRRRPPQICRSVPLLRHWTVLACLALAPHCLFAAVMDASLEYRVKAAFLLNFTKFVEWPPEEFADSDSPITICILGDDPFGPALDRMVAGEDVNGRKVLVQRIRHEPSKSCQVLFIGRLERDVPKILASLGRGTLTVGEGENFLREGGMIAFVIDNRRVRFDIKRNAAEGAALKLSSKLLNVARSVEN
jgi:hypothetical protein